MVCGNGWIGEIGAVVFDLDNTLYDRDANVRAWLEMIFSHQPELALEGAAFDDSGFIPRAEFYDWVLQRVDWAETAKDVKLRFQTDVLRSVGPDPRVTRLIRSLADRFVLGVLTNGEIDYQLAKFRRLEMEDCFHPSRVIATDAIGVHKPEPGAFEAIRAAVGLPPERILFVGDNPVNDIEGASAVQMRTCWIQLRPHHGCLVAPDLRVSSILELEGVFDGTEQDAGSR